MNDRHYILATAGHVDHGKSALVRALTGTDPDRLPEEKARGITIDLGFAHLTLPGCDVGIVDVPGHEDFVKNMVAGVGSIDAALLVVAADDRWMPQTEEHLQILTHLGVRHGVVALSKADLLSDPAAAVAQLREKLASTFLADAAIVPTSVPRQSGLEELRSGLEELFARLPPQADIGKPRLAVDRAFTLQGVGTIVTGTLAGGTFSTGQAVAIQPASTPSHLRALQTHGRAVPAAQPGMRVALNLPNVAPAAARGHRLADTVARGDVITLPALGPAVRRFDALLEYWPRSQWRPRSDKNVWLHLGTAAVPARVAIIQDDPPLARIRLASPQFALAGDRFILRDGAERRTLAGGVVLDIDPIRLRHTRQLELLRTRAAHPHDAKAWLLALLTRDGIVQRGAALLRSRFAGDAISEAMLEIVKDGGAVQEKGLLIETGLWLGLIATAAATVDQFHAAHPERAGVPMAELQNSVHRSGAAADAVVNALCRDGFVRRGAAIARAAHFPALPPRLQNAGARIRSLLRAHPFDPPSRRELAQDDAAFQALKFLIATGEAVEVGPDVVLSAEAYARAVAKVREFLAERGKATVSELKTGLASSRRVMVPLVEKLDRDGITRRQGDVRVLRGP